MARRIFLTICFFSFLNPIKAQEPYAIHIGTEKGLPGNRVYDLVEDSKGFLWVATDEGLARYDGFSFQSFTNPAQTSRPGSYIQEDRWGRIWYGNFDGSIYYVEHDTLKAFPFHHKSLQFGVFGDRMWLMLEQGLTLVDLEKFAILKVFPLNVQTFSQLEWLGNKVIGMSDALLEADFNGNIRELPMPDRKLNFSQYVQLDNLVFGLQENPEGIALWAWENSPLKPIKMGHWGRLGIINQFNAAGNSLWICTRQGAVQLTDGFKNTQLFFPDASISKVVTDHYGQTWFATLDQGLILVPRMSTQQWVIPNDRPTALLSTSYGLVIGTAKGQLFSLNHGQLKPEGSMGLPQEAYAFALGAPLEEPMILGREHFEGFPWHGAQLYAAQKGLKEMAIIDSQLLVCARSGLVDVYRLKYPGNPKNTWLTWYNGLEKQIHLLSEGRITSLRNLRAKSIVYHPGHRALYVCTNFGLYKITPFETTTLSLEGKPVLASRVVMWDESTAVLTNNGELLRIDDKGNLSRMVKVPENIRNIKYLNGILHLVTFSALYRMEKKGAEYVSELVTGFPDPLDVTDMSVWENQVVLASPKGLLFLPAQPCRLSAAIIPFYIQYLQSGHERVEWGVHPDWAYDKNQVEIGVSYPFFTRDIPVVLEYQINEGDWMVMPASSRTLNLPSLTPGNYKVQFRLNGILQNKVVEFTIQEPWWRQWFVQVGIGFILILGIAFIYRWRLRQYKERTRLAAEKEQLERDLRQSRLSSIKSQMNPHFLFNALNTIQAFIFSEDKKNASGYLSTFSRLTRMILEMSERETVSLAEEIEALNLYLELENMRFDNLNYSLEVKPGINPDEVKIPSMIIQPYVENAIKHGLLHKKENRKLQLAFSRGEDGLLEISIDDNGIGRKRSEALNRKRQPNYQPFSTQANLKRIELLNVGNPAIGVTYMDKPDGQGTTVIIRLSMN